MSPTPEIKAKLVLVNSATGGASGGVGGGGVFSKSEERSFRLEQTKAFRFARLAGGKNVGILATIAKLLGPTGALALATIAGTATIALGLKKILDKYGPKGPDIETPEETKKPWSSLTPTQKKKRLAGSASIEPKSGEIPEQGGLGGGTLAGSGPGRYEMEQQEKALADLNITTPLTTRELNALGNTTGNTTDTMNNFERGMKILGVEQNALVTSIISSNNRLSSMVGSLGSGSRGGSTGGGTVIRKLTGPEKQSVQQAFMPLAGEETAGDVIRRLRAQTKSGGQSNNS